MPVPPNIPRPTAKRLSYYLRELEAQADLGTKTISSKGLGERLGLTDAQVRKDLACFGQFGHPGVGYGIDELTGQLRRILGMDRQWTAVVVGAGNIGRAIASYGRLADKGFEIIAVLDDDPDVIGLRFGGHEVRPATDLESVVREHDVRIGLVAVPAGAAQRVADNMIAAGVRGVLNFAPVRLAVPDGIAIVSVDLTISLEQLAFKLTLGMPSGEFGT